MLFLGAVIFLLGPGSIGPGPHFDVFDVFRLIMDELRVAPEPLPAKRSKIADSRAFQCNFTVRDFAGFRFFGSGNSRKNVPHGERSVNALGGRGGAASFENLRGGV